MSITITERLVSVGACCECGVQFGVTQAYDAARQSDGKTFYCPNGHGQAYTETDAMRLRKAEERLAEETRRRKAAQDLLRAEERSHSATRGHLTRTKKRVAGGVCPCCNRSFVKLAAHMKTKHPHYVEGGS